LIIDVSLLCLLLLYIKSSPVDYHFSLARQDHVFILVVVANEGGAGGGSAAHSSLLEDDVDGVAAAIRRVIRDGGVVPASA
jgi:hypothetical protein